MATDDYTHSFPSESIFIRDSVSLKHLEEILAKEPNKYTEVDVDIAKSAFRAMEVLTAADHDFDETQKLIANYIAAETKVRGGNIQTVCSLIAVFTIWFCSRRMREKEVVEEDTGPVIYAKIKGPYDD